jgi:hypothetical protein
LEEEEEASQGTEYSACNGARFTHARSL